MFEKVNIIFLASSSLGHDCLDQVSEFHNIVAVLTDKKSTSVIEYCKLNNIEFYVGNPRGGKAANFLKSLSLPSQCLILSVNYLYIIENDLITLVKGEAFNIHGSLLPKYRGRTPHVWAIINGEKETGITLHYIDEGCDTGDIVIQSTVTISKEETGNDILVKFTKLYPELILNFLKKYPKGNFSRTKQIEENATSFPKRTPKDGLINWKMTSTEIYNWIRAQASPYPGAFTYYKNKKVTIDKSTESIDKKNSKIPGTIVSKSNGHFVVAAEDGSLKVETFRGLDIDDIEVGVTLNNEGEL